MGEGDAAAKRAEQVRQLANRVDSSTPLAAEGTQDNNDPAPADDLDVFDDEIAERLDAWL